VKLPPGKVRKPEPPAIVSTGRLQWRVNLGVAGRGVAVGEGLATGNVLADGEDWLLGDAGGGWVATGVLQAATRSSSAGKVRSISLKS
jgi:hypothetical protein